MNLLGLPKSKDGSRSMPEAANAAIASAASDQRPGAGLQHSLSAPEARSPDNLEEISINSEVRSYHTSSRLAWRSLASIGVDRT